VSESSLAGFIKDQDVASSMGVLAWVIIVVGAIVLIIGFLGCCGAIRESQCMLATVIPRFNSLRIFSFKLIQSVF